MCVCLCVCLVTQSCLAVCDPKDCCPPSSSVHIFQARTVELVSISSSRDLLDPGNCVFMTRIPCVSWIGRQILYHWATQEAHIGAHHNRHGLLHYPYLFLIVTGRRSIPWFLFFCNRKGCKLFFTFLLTFILLLSLDCTCN